MSSGLFTSGRRIGELVWAESRLFEVTGRWVESIPEPQAKAFVASAGRHHGWHAELLADLLPATADGPRPDDFIAPSEEWTDLVADLDGLVGTAARVQRVWGDVVPALMASAQAHVAGSSAVAEGAVHRVLGIVIAEEQVDVAAAARVLERL